MKTGGRHLVFSLTLAIVRRLIMSRLIIDSGQLNCLIFLLNSKLTKNQVLLQMTHQGVLSVCVSSCTVEE